MNPIQKFLAGAMHRLTGGQFRAESDWEGARPSRARQRQSLRLVSEDTGLNNGTREQMMSDARTLCRNFSIGDAILARFADYCVDPNAGVKWFTSDHEWNQLAEANWQRRCLTMDAQGMNSFPEMLRLCVQSAKRDGDVFLHMEKEGDEPMLCAIEADRVTNAKGGSVTYDAPLPSNVARNVGGVDVDARGRPVRFIVADRSGYGTFVNPKPVAAAEMLHYLNPRRFESYRGVTAFASVLNVLTDLKETKDAEVMAAKVASFHTLVEKNGTGTAQGIPSPWNTETNSAGATRNLEDLSYGLKRYVARADDISMFMSERPAEGWRWLVVFCIREIAVGLNLPFEFVWDLSGLGGAGVRLMSRQAQRTFQAETAQLERRVICPTVLWVTACDMQSGLLPFNEDFHRFKPQRPAHPTVDVGRESSANLAELNAGVGLEETILAEQGIDAGANRRKRQGEVMDRINLAKEIQAEHPEMELAFILQMMGTANAQTSAMISQMEEAKEVEPAKP